MTSSEIANTNPQSLRRASLWMAHACLATMIALPAAVVAYWLMADTAQLAVRAQLPANAVQAQLSVSQRYAGAAITLLPLTLLLLGLRQARECFKHFAAGEVFTAATVRCLRRFAGWVAVSVAASMIASTAISVLLTLNNPPGLHHLAIGIGTDQLFTLFFAGMVWLMAAVIGQGQVLAEENAKFV
jgi:hypothetical protein